MRCHPETSGLILQDAQNIVIDQAFRIVWAVAVGVNIARVGVQAAQPGQCAQPERTMAIFEQTGIGICLLAERLARWLNIVSESAGLAVKGFQATAQGAQPDAALPAFHDRSNAVIAQTLRIVGIIAVKLETLYLWVELIQAAIGCAHPEQAAAVLEKSPNQVELRLSGLAELLRWW